MKNTLIFFYDIAPETISKINNEYFFMYNNASYTLSLYTRRLDEASTIYELNKEMLSKGINTYTIILTKDKSILISYDNNYYILMIIPEVKNRLIDLSDILEYRYIPETKTITIDKSNWPLLWENKIDYIEEQFKEMHNKYKIISKSINYYIGLWENAITYYNNTNHNNNIKEVCHKRITVKTDILSFINPLNFVIDNKTRDVAEYIKSYIYEENFTKKTITSFLSKLRLDNETVNLFISRLLFPSNYFDIYEDIILLGKKEELIEEITKKNKNFIILMKIVFNYYITYNIHAISWIKKEN